MNVQQAGIEKRLTKSFAKVSAITVAVALLGLIAVLVVSNRYSYALHNYGFAQGDIGKTMFEFADLRSSLRAAIGYDDPDAIAAVVEQHEQSKAAFEENFALIENTIVSAEGRKTYDEIKAELETYWKLDQEIMDIGATTDRELCKQAQDIALGELADVYNSIYIKLEELLNVKVKEGNRLSVILNGTGWVLAAAMVAAAVVAIVFSTKIGKSIAVRISEPLGKLGSRLKTFATGDLSSPFPLVETGDEVEHMEKDATEMANNLNVIIHDIDEVLGQMAGGNYAVQSNASDRYTGDFGKLYESMYSLREQMTQTLISIGEASEHVSIGSGDLATASQSLAEGATEQAQAVQELHATISDIAVTMEKSAKSAQHYANEADNSREEMDTMMAAMQRINDASTRIGDIISEIESIAAQTNLLSLNASIEAARAGESGRGFAVVADQIRQLADQSAQAAVDTRELIEGSIREVTEGNRAAERASNAIASVVDGIKQIADFSKNLKGMVEDQSEAMHQAELGINQISEVVQSNAATAEEASATSEELSAQAQILDELVGQFILEK